MTVPSISSFVRELKQTLGPKRFSHSLGVAAMSASLARRNGYPPRKAYLAGLLHDNAKSLGFRDSKRGMMKLKANGSDMAIPALWHASLGAVRAREKFEIRDPEIIAAIRWHAAGAEKMKGLAVILYVADYLEAGRAFPGLKRLRKLAERNLGQAFRAVVARKILHLHARGRLVHFQSYRLWRRLMAGGPSPI